VSGCAKSIMKMHIANSYGLGGPIWKLLALSFSYLTVRICVAKKKRKRTFLYLYSISLVHQINFLRVDLGTGFALQDIW
jgi:Na+/H+ antiporter NhaA